MTDKPKAIDAMSAIVFVDEYLILQESKNVRSGVFVFDSAPTIVEALKLLSRHSRNFPNQKFYVYNKIVH